MTNPVRILYLGLSDDRAYAAEQHLRQADGAVQVVRAACETDFAPVLAEAEMVLVELPGAEQLPSDLLGRLRADRPGLPVVLLVETLRDNAAADAIRAGADDVLTFVELPRLTWILLRHRRRHGGFRDSPDRYRAEQEPILAHRRTAEAPEDSQIRYRDLFEESPVSLWVADFSAMKAFIDRLKAGGVTDARAHLDAHPEDVSHVMSLLRVLDVNRRAVELYRASSKEQLLGSLHKVAGEWALDAYRDTILAIAEGRTRHEMELINHTLTGGNLLIHLRWSVVPGYEGTFGRVLISVLDITAHKRIEQALRENQRALATLMSNLPGMAFRCRNDREWTMEFVSDGCLALTGYRPAELINNAVVSYGGIMHREDHDRVWSDIQGAVREKRPYQTAYRIHTADGRTRWVWEQGRGVFGPDDQLLALEGFTTDITERVHAEQALRRSEDMYRTLFETMTQGVVYIDATGEITAANPAAERIFGLTLEQMRTQPLQDPRWDVIHEDGSPYRIEDYPALVALRSGVPVSGKILGVLNPTTGQRRWISVGAVPLVGPRDPDGRQVYITLEDITERKIVQMALDENRRFTSRIIDTNPNLIYIYDLRQQRHVHFTANVQRILGYNPEELLSMPAEAARALVHPDDAPKVMDHLARFANIAEGELLEVEYRVRHADGHWVLLHSRDLLFSRSPDGAPQQLIGTAADVTEARRAEQALRESEERFRRLAENAQDAILRYRLWPTRGFDYVSPAITTIAGYSQEECYQDPGFLPHALHPDDQPRVHDYLDGKLPFHLPIVLRLGRPDGSYTTIELRSTPIYDTAGRLIAIEGIARDISERKRAEQALIEQASLRELSHRILSSQEEERRRLSRELHDEAGQALTAIKINTELLAKRMPSDQPNLRRLAQDTAELTAGLISEMRRIAAALRPAVLEDLGLLPTLRWYTKNIEMRYGLRVKLISRGIKGRLVESFETTIYRIVQEALTNVVRHAQAQHVLVKVTSGRSGMDLVIHDDGRGMDVTSVSSGTGLTGIRERTHLFGGTMELESLPGTGTTLRVMFPVVPEAPSCVRQ